MLKHRRLAAAVVAATATLAVGIPASSTWGDVIWTGPVATPRGSGDWGTASNWNGAAVPTSSDSVYIQGVSQGAGADPTVATITIGDGVNPYAAVGNNLIARYGKTATIALNNQATLTLSGLVDSGGNADAAPSHLTFQGPASGSATVNMPRYYVERDLPAPNTLTFSGPNLTVNLGVGTGANYSYLTFGNAMIVSGGASVTNTLAYNLAVAPNTATSAASRMTIQQGAVSGLYMDDSGLVQLASGGTVSMTQSGQNFYVRSGGRFEGEGGGLNSNVGVRVFGGGTLAVGLTDPITHTRTSAATLTLNSTTELDATSNVIFGIFNHTSNDQLNFASGVSLSSSGAYLKLQTFGYTPTPGDTFTLLSGSVPNYAWNTSQVDTNVWNLSKFNSADGWKVSVVPEPTTLTLLGLGAAGLLLKRRRRA